MAPLTLRQELLRYAIASVTLLFFTAGWGFILSQGIVEWPVAALDIGLGVIGLVLLHWRRRFPLTITVATALLAASSGAAIGAACVALVSLSTQRRLGRTVLAGSVLWLTFVGRSAVESGWTAPTLVAAIGGGMTIAGLIGIGIYIRSIRDLSDAQRRLQDREHLDGLERARSGERARIAREMHDVLAHRLSILSLHAGALAHRGDLSADEVRQTAAVIRDNSHASLEELRATLGALREEDPLGLPQPSFGDLPQLIAEVKEAGQVVSYSTSVQHADQVPPQVGRHAFRIVQEALTNARKHSPGAAVTVELAGSPGSSLQIRIANALNSFRTPTAGLSGLGLIGLGERAALVGGTLTHRDDGDRFIVEATLPWSVNG